MSRTTKFLAWSAAAALHAALFTQPVNADECERYGVHRDTYLSQSGAGAEQALRQMASQRRVPQEAAAFYWGAQLMRQSDEASLDALAQLTLVTYGWDDNRDRAETAMTRLADERGSARAAFYAGLMLSDGQGPQDPYRARLYLRDAARAGDDNASAFLGLYEACDSLMMAAN